jgi:P63C domain
LASNAIKSFISEDLMARVNSPLEYTPTHGGRSALGYDGALLPEICDVIVSAKDQGALRSSQVHYAEMAQILLKGIAVIGIYGLIDEATGYQDIRDRVALQAILEEWLGKELARWAKTFQDDFYSELFRLKWQTSPGPKGRKPGVVAHWTKDIIYDRLTPGLLRELERLARDEETGKRRGRLFQWLSQQHGYVKLTEHLSNVTFLMKASPNWTTFYRLLQRSAPKQGSNLALPLTYKGNEDFEEQAS